MDLLALSRAAWIRRPGHRAEALGLALARSIFDLELSAIGRRLRQALTGQLRSHNEVADSSRSKVPSTRT